LCLLTVPQADCMCRVRFCQDIGHDPAFFKVKSSNLVYCLVCNKTFKLHAKGQITRGNFLKANFLFA